MFRKKPELLVPGQIDVRNTENSRSAPRATATAKIPDNGIWLAGRAEDVRPLATCAPHAPVSLKRVAASKIAAPDGTAPPEGSIYSLGDLEVLTARLFATPEGLSRFVISVVSSLRGAAAMGAVTSIGGPAARALEPERAGFRCAIIATGSAGRAFSLQGSGLGDMGEPGASGIRAAVHVAHDARGLPAISDVVSVARARTPARALMASRVVEVTGLGRVSFLIIGDARRSGRPRRAVTIACVKDADQGGLLRHLFRAVAESLGLMRSNKLSAARVTPRARRASAMPLPLALDTKASMSLGHLAPGTDAASGDAQSHSFDNPPDWGRTHSPTHND